MSEQPLTAAYAFNVAGTRRRPHNEPNDILDVLEVESFYHIMEVLPSLILFEMMVFKKISV